MSARKSGALLLAATIGMLLVSTATRPSAQAVQNATVRVTETWGIRRTEFPVRAEIRVPEKTLADVARVQLQAAGAPVPAQFTITSKWPDGSARTLDVDFNATLNPGESRTYQVIYGASVASSPSPARGFAATEAGTLLRIGGAAFSMNGAPLIASAMYAKSEFIAQFDGARNGVVLIDTAGRRHELSGARDLTLETIKPGPLAATLRFSGQIPIDAGVTVPFTVTIDMPNSKSWIKVTASVVDPSRRVRELEIATPLAMGAFPWTWDFGTENGTYGAFRTSNDAALFTQVVGTSAQAHSWKVETGNQNELRPYEMSRSDSSARMTTAWGHLVGSTAAVAFGIDGFGETPGTYTVALNGQGQATYRFSPGTGTAHRFGVYQHFVSTPVPIGAATTPTSMLHPPVVTVA